MKKLRLLFVSLLFLTTRASAQADVLKLQLGLELTQVYLPVKPVGSVQYQPGFGVIGSFKLHKSLFFDSGFSITPMVPVTSTSFAGGRLTEGFFGVRAGVSKGRWGLYAKARPGVVSFGQAIIRATLAPNLQTFMGRLTEPAVDIGAVVEAEVSRHIVFRYELGDTIIFYRSRRLFANQQAVPGRVVNALQFGIGFAIRF